MKNQTNQKLGWPLLLITAGLSLFITAFITTTSPLFAFNNSWDGNTMFTVGKGLWHGLMPYRDLFDQRGPLIYLMNSIAALISYKSFFGVFLFETFAVFLSIVLAYRILNLKFSKPIAFASVFTIIPIIFNDYFFENGELPESLIMPMVLSLIYVVLKNNGKATNNRQLISQGIALALVFWIKYSLILPWIAFFGWLGIKAVYQFNWRELFRIIWTSLTGFMIISFPLIIFYWLMGALRALFHVYFVINLKYYPSSDLASFQPLRNIFEFVFRNWRTTTISGLMLVGIICFMGIKSIKWSAKLIVLAGLGLEILFIVGNTYSYRYYFVGLGVYMLLLAFGIGTGLTSITKHRWINIKILSPLVIIISCGLIFVTNHSYQQTILFPHNQSISTNRKATEPFQIQFAKIIDQHHDRSILNYNNLDVGVYTATGTLPQTKYFAKLNLKHYSPLMATQDQILNQKQARFVIFTLLKHEKISDARHHPNRSFYRAYKLVARRNAVFQNHKMKYLLYELRS